MAYDITSFIIHSHLGTLGQSRSMSHLDLNVVSWYYNKPKFDLRYWTEDYNIDKKSGGSITLTLDQIKALKHILNQYDFSQFEKVTDYGTRVETPLDGEPNLNSVRKEVIAHPPKSPTEVQSFEQPLDEHEFPWDNY